MDSIKIYSSDGALLIDAVLEGSSAQDWGIMSENQVSLDFYTAECIILPASCYIDYEGQRFWLLDEYKPTENNSAEWSYQVRFLGAESLLAVTVVLNQTDGSDEPIFNLTAPASQHLELIVSNLNRRFPGMGWSVGSVPSTENIFIEYAGTYASDALQTIVGDKYEWWVDDFVVNIGRCEFGERIELGYQNGLLGGITYSTANEMRSYAYLYPIGSTRNIDPSKYGYSRLQLPDGLTRIDINPEQGLAELVESDAFADIFPRYVGKVTAVRTSSGKNEDGTSFTIYHIKDSSIPFNPNNYEIAGEVKQITFQSGELMGAEFEVNYDADNKEFEIITQFQNGGLSQLPGGALIPKVGDKYVVWNISMPDEYYPLAEQEFLQAALAFASESVKEASVYRAPVDFIEVQQRGLRLRPGQRVRLLSNEYFPDKGYYDSRITRITRDVCYPDEITIEVSSVVSKGTISRLRNSVNDSATKVASLGQSLKNYVDITSAQSIFGAKNFVNGFTLAGVKMYRHVDGYVYLDETLVLKGGVVMYGNSSGVDVPSIFDSLPIDGKTIKRDGNGALYVDEKALTISGGGGGGGVADSVHWNNVTGKPSWIGSTKPSYKYSEIEEKPDLSVYALKTTIPTKLSQLTDDVVAGNYLSTKGGTINGSITATSFIGNLTGNVIANSLCVNSQVLLKYTADDYKFKDVLSFTWSSDANDGIKLSVPGWHTEDTFLHLTALKGAMFSHTVTASTFIGALQGNADSATKLATPRTIWGQRFDGTGKITGDIAFEDNKKISWHNQPSNYYINSPVTNDGAYLQYMAFLGHRFLGGNVAIGGTTADAKLHVHGNGIFTDNLSVPSITVGGVTLRKVDNYLYLDSSLVLSGGVTMYGDDGTTVKPIWESIPLDSSTLAWLDGKLSVIGGVGGGGISEEFLNVKLQGYQPLLSASNKLPYSLISGTPTIPTKLSQLTDDVVSGKYLPIAGGAVNGNLEVSSHIIASQLTVGSIRLSDNILLFKTSDGTLANTVYVTSNQLRIGYGTANYHKMQTLLLGYGIVFRAQGDSTNTFTLLSDGSGVFKSSVTATSFIGNLTGTASGNLPLTGGTINGTSYNPLSIASNDNSLTQVYLYTKDTLRGIVQYNVNYGVGFHNSGKGGIYVKDDGTPIFIDSSVTSKTLLHAGNYSNLLAGGTINGSLTATSFIGNLTGNVIANSLNVNSQILLKYTADDYKFKNVLSFTWSSDAGDGIKLSVPGWHTEDTFLHLTALKGAMFSHTVTASTFIGALQGNADSATKLANPRTIWGQSFDGTGNITGAMTIDGDATFSSKVVIGTIPVEESVDGTLYVDANVVFRGGVAMFGNTTTIVNEE